jgi:hypothetical protein
LVELARRVRRLAGVRAVWLHRFSEQHAGMWVLTSGDDSGWFHRRLVHAEVVNYLRFHRPAMEECGFTFEKYVFMEHEERQHPSIPSEAREIAA